MYAFENNFSYLLQNNDPPQEWRKTRYYNEQTDNFIQAHLPLFIGLYKTWATKKDQGKKDKFMTLDDFTGFCTTLVGVDCPMRDIPLFFNQSIHIQENEIDGDRHTVISLSEFIECTCRVIDKANQKDPSLYLYQKLDAIRPNFQKLIGTALDVKNIKEKFILPKKNTELNIYEFDRNSMFYLNILFPPEEYIQHEVSLQKREAMVSSFKNFKNSIEKIGQLKSMKDTFFSSSSGSTDNINLQKITSKENFIPTIQIEVKDNEAEKILINDNKDSDDEDE